MLTHEKEKSMDKFIEKLQSYLLPFSTKVANNKVLSSFGEGITATFPVIMIGSIAVLLASVDIGGYQGFIVATDLKTVFQAVQNLTMGIVGLYCGGTIAYQLSVKLEVDPLSSVVSTLASFILIQGYTPGTISTAYLGAPGLFLAMILAVIVPYLTKFMFDKRLYIRLPQGIPAIVERSFAALTPSAVIIISIGFLQWGIGKTDYGNLPTLFYAMIQQPLSKIGLSFAGYSIVNVIADATFFCGIHGNSINSVLQPILLAASAENLAAFSAGLPLPNIINGGLSLFANLGGGGAVFGLQMCMLFFAKSDRLKALNKVTLVPCLFNISEPLLFGVPIMLNPILFIPFVFVPVINRTIAYVLTVVGIMPILNGVSAPWTLPSFVRVMMSGGGVVGVIVVFACMLLSVVVYYPFFRIVDRQYLDKEQALKVD